MSASWINIDKLGTKGVEPDLMPPHREPQSFDDAVNVRSLGPNIANAGGYAAVSGGGFPSAPEIPPDGVDWDAPGCCDQMTQIVHTTGLNLDEQAYTGRYESGKFLFQNENNVYSFDEAGFDGRVGDVPSPFLTPASDGCIPGAASIGTLKGVHLYVTQTPDGETPVTGCFTWYHMIGDTVVGMNEEARTELGLALVDSASATLPLRRVHSSYTVPFSDENPNCAEYWVIAQHTDGYFVYRFTDNTLPTPYQCVWRSDQACFPLNSQHDASLWNAWSGPGAIEPTGKYMWALANGWGRVQLKTIDVKHASRVITISLRDDTGGAITANRRGGAVATGKFALMARNQCAIYTRSGCT